MNMVKKLVIITAFLCAVTIANAEEIANAEDGLKIGARVGYSMQSTDIPLAEMGKLGVGVGAVFNIPVGPVVIAPEVAFLYRNNYSYSFGGIDYSQTEFAVSIPVMVRWFPKETFYITVGAQVDIPIAAESCVNSDCIDMDGKEGRPERAAVDAGIASGAGYMIMPNLSIDFRWVLGMLTHHKYEESDLSANNGKVSLESGKMSSFGFGVTYFF